jgi:uncharacterized membrane protein
LRDLSVLSVWLDVLRLNSFRMTSLILVITFGFSVYIGLKEKSNSDFDCYVNR